MYRQMLINNIVNHLHENDLLKETDEEKVLQDVRAIVEYELQNYKLIVGNVY